MLPIVFNNRVSIGSAAHIIPIIVALLLAIIFIKIAKRLNKSQQHQLIHYFACFVAVFFIGYDFYRIYLGTYNFKTHLPLFLCNLLAVLAPIFTYYRKYWMFEILVFWIIGGTLQAVITPDVVNDVISYAYFRYWVEHLGLLIIIFYFIFVFKMKPRHFSIYKSFLALQLYIAAVYVLNDFLGSNYSYLNEKPKSATLLDLFGDWPYYILMCYLIVIPLFYLIYLPFYLTRKST